jgi:hypothetical protein
MAYNTNPPPGAYPQTMPVQGGAPAYPQSPPPQTLNPPPPTMPVQGGGVAYPPPPPHAVGVPIPPPQQPQQPQPIVVGYERRLTDDSCCSCDLSGMGIAWTIVLLLFCFPLAFLPFVLKPCRNKVSVPIYAVPVVAPAR